MPAAPRYTLIERPAELLSGVAPDSITSRTLHSDDRIKVTLFAFDAGQELSEHRSSHPVTLQLLAGSARIGLGPDMHELDAGAWIHLPADLVHSVAATTPLLLLLTMIRS